MRVFRLAAVISALSVCPAFAQLSSELVVSGLSSPVAVVQDPTQPAVQFVVEQGGRIRVVRAGQIEALDFLDLTPLVLSGGERGLLGLAFAPDYATSGRFYVNYTRQPDGHTVIARYQRSAGNPLLADPSSAFNLRWPDGNDFLVQPFANHNGGDLQFGSDGFLYIPLGDGGSSNDPDHRAQDPAQLLGKVLRIDVDVPAADFEGYDVPPDNPFVGQSGVLPEIWAFGLRNPFRFTVDALERGGTGALVIADVGQNAWEEVNYEPFGEGGRNYGWRNREGAHDNVVTLPPAFTPLTDPFLEYSHAEGNVITGGVVYRGTGLGVGFFGRYFFADFGAQRIWSVGVVVDPATHEAQKGQIIEHTSDLGGAATIGSVSGFGVGADCEIYFVNWSAGQLRRIVNPAGPSASCPTSADPFLADGGGVFVDGVWVSRDHPLAAGAGLGGVAPGGSTTGCSTPQPVSNWVCVNGGWVPPDHPLADSGSAPPPPPPPDGTGSGTTGCTTVQPVSTWVCVNGGWLPPDHPLAAGSGSTPPPPPPDGTGSGSTGCTTVQPVSTWVCVNGGWLPPDHPLAAGSGSAPPPPPPPPPDGTGTGTTGCTTVQPVSTWVCVNGGWLPPDHPLAVGSGSTPPPPPPPDGTGTGTTGCTTVQPVSNWVCVNGGWLPPDHPLATGGSGGQ